MNDFDLMLRGGHPNSLGRTLEVVDIILADRARLNDLIDTYGSDDPVVRLRVSNTLKRIEAAHPDWLTPLLDRLIAEVGPLDQPSAQWTLAQLFLRQTAFLSAAQRTPALGLMKRNLANSTDWIVLNTTMDTLTGWAKTDRGLEEWLAPHLERLTADPRRSVAARARKALAALGKH